MTCLLWWSILNDLNTYHLRKNEQILFSVGQVMLKLFLSCKHFSAEMILMKHDMENIQNMINYI